jgi:hypothetical protein
MIIYAIYKFKTVKLHSLIEKKLSLHKLNNTKLNFKYKKIYETYVIPHVTLTFFFFFFVRYIKKYIYNFIVYFNIEA